MRGEEFETIDAYLASLDKEKRAALRKLRKDIRAAAPGAVECVSYGIPAFRIDGKMLFAFGAYAKHCSFYPGAHPVKAHAKELAAYSTSKGTIRFPTDEPLSAALVRRLVRARIAEHVASPRIPGSRR